MVAQSCTQLSVECLVGAGVNSEKQCDNQLSYFDTSKVTSKYIKYIIMIQHDIASSFLVDTSNGSNDL